MYGTQVPEVLTTKQKICHVPPLLLTSKAEENGFLIFRSRVSVGGLGMSNILRMNSEFNVIVCAIEIKLFTFQYTNSPLSSAPIKNELSDEKVTYRRH